LIVAAKNRQLIRAHGDVPPGEGFPVEIIHRFQDAAGAVSVELDLTSAPVPNRSYWADTATINQVDGMIRIMFGQRQVTGTSLRSLVIIYLTELDAKRFLSTCEKFRSTLENTLNNLGAVSPPQFSIEQEPAGTVPLGANIVTASFSGAMANLDFYSLSPRMLVEFTRRELDKIAIDPVVRVILRTSLLATVIEGVGVACQTAAQESRNG
jgi:hypothetical protein